MEDTGDELGEGEQRIVDDYNKRFRSLEYHRVFSRLASGEYQVAGSCPDAYFEAASLLVRGITNGELREEVEGIAAAFLCRHYLELAIKYTLFHSRWLKTAGLNAADKDVPPVERGHDLSKLWSALISELRLKGGGAVPKGLDLQFVKAFAGEFQAVDRGGDRFRYPAKLIGIGASWPEKFGVNYQALLFNLQRTHDILETLDAWLIETYGQNQEWESIQGSW